MSDSEAPQTNTTNAAAENTTSASEEQLSAIRSLILAERERCAEAYRTMEERERERKEQHSQHESCMTELRDRLAHLQQSDDRYRQARQERLQSGLIGEEGNDMSRLLGAIEECGRERTADVMSFFADDLGGGKGLRS